MLAFNKSNLVKSVFYDIYSEVKIKISLYEIFDEYLTEILEIKCHLKIIQQSSLQLSPCNLPYAN